MAPAPSVCTIWNLPMFAGSGTAGLLELTSSSSSSRGPAQPAAAQEVQVDVVDAVPGVVAAVHHEPEAAVGEVQLAGEVAGLAHHRPDEDVHGRLGTDVVERDELVVGVHRPRRTLALGDLAEEAAHPRLESTAPAAAAGRRGLSAASASRRRRGARPPPRVGPTGSARGRSAPGASGATGSPRV